MSFRRQHDEDPSINLTPMIDVVFLLVIFFLVGAKFSEREGRIPIDVPGVGRLTAVATGPDRRIIEITRDGRLLLDARDTRIDALGTELRAAVANYPRLQVLVRGDAGQTFQRVAEVLHVCRQSGVQELGVAVQSDRR